MVSNFIVSHRFSFKVHAQEIEKTRQSLENKKDEERRAIEDKLKAAESMRDENIKKMLDRLKEHVSVVLSLPLITFVTLFSIAWQKITSKPTFIYFKKSFFFFG